ncbi:MotA/TolQ/ExbB proton channel family protein [Candidatus Latescibacterota bacterium]
MIELFVAGGPLMYALLLAAILGIAVIFERLMVLFRIPAPQKAEKQLAQIEEVLQSGSLEECAKVVSKGKGILNYVFARLLKRYDTLVIEKKDLERIRGTQESDLSKDPVAKFLADQAEVAEFREELHITVDDATRTYVTRFLPVLSTVGNVSPLLGLLGTITGMITAFESIATSGTGDPRVVAGGISQALITTATGLIVAIPAIIGYRYLGGRADRARSSVEMYALAFSNTLLAQLERE